MGYAARRREQEGQIGAGNPRRGRAPLPVAERQKLAEAELRMLARRIETVEQFEGIVAQVKPSMRTAVRALLTRHVRFQVPDENPYHPIGVPVGSPLATGAGQTGTTITLHIQKAPECSTS